MKKILLLLFMSSLAIYSFSQENNPGCLDKTFPFFTPADGFYLTDNCKFSEFDSYEFVIDRNTRSIKKEGVYREVWFHKKGDSNRHMSGTQILQNHVNAIKAAGGEVVKESDGSVFKIIYKNKEIWIYVNSNTYSTDLDNYGIISIELENTKKETIVPEPSETTDSPVISGSQISKQFIRSDGASEEGSTTLTGVIDNVDPVKPAGSNDFEKSFGVTDFEDISVVSIREGLAIPENAQETVGTAINLPQAVIERIHTFKGNSAVVQATIFAANREHPLVSRGFCWGTTPHPTTANRSMIYTSLADTLKGLTPGTTYYVRPFATTNTGTTYGNELSFHSGYVYGSLHAGGVVFYNDGKGHGMTCAEADQYAGAAAAWGCKGGLIGVTGSGSERTNAIVSMCRTNNIAARICFFLVLNNYSDWYLPSFEEFQLLERNLIRNNLLGGIDTRYVYWTSSERDRYRAYGWALSEGLGHINKDLGANVRAIRNF